MDMSCGISWPLVLPRWHRRDVLQHSSDRQWPYRVFAVEAIVRVIDMDSRITRNKHT